MKQFLRKLDFYGKTPSFHFFGKESAETLIGGVISFTIFLCFILFSLIFGQDFFFRTRPRVISSLERPASSSMSRWSTSDLPFMFRVEDFRGNPIDYSKLLFTSVLHWEYVEDPDTKQLTMKNHTMNTLIECPINAEFMQYFNKDSSTYLCFDWSNQTIGGSIEEKFNHYFTFFVSFCPTGYYNPNTCTDPSEIDKVALSKNPWYFSFYYPEYYLQPNDIDNPLRVKYTNYLRRVSRDMVKYDEFRFQKVILNNDKGILWHTNNNITRLALFSRESEYYYYENTKDTLVKNSPAMLYQATISLSKDYDFHDRIYVKLQDVAAQIAGFLRIVVFVLVFFDVKASCLFLNASLVNHLFNFKQDSSAQPKLNNSKNIFKKSSIKLFLGKEVKQCHYLNSKKKEEGDRLSTDLTSMDFKLIKYSSIGKSIEGRKSAKEFSIFNYGLKFTQYSFCRACKTNDQQGKKYRYAYEVIQKRMDISYYFKIMLELSFMKHLLFNDHEITAIDNCKRPNINQLQELSSFYQFYSPEDEAKRVKEFLEYYNFKVTNESEENVDLNNSNNGNQSVNDYLNNSDPNKMKVFGAIPEVKLNLMANEL